MNDESLELVKAATEGGIEAFFRTVCAALVETGEWAADVVRRQRLKTQVKTMRLARDMLQEAGLQATAVPAKTLVPLLQLSSLEDEDDDDMHGRWAALLANAAAGGASNQHVLPSFPAILAELTAPEAAILDQLNRLSAMSGRKRVRTDLRRPVALDALASESGYGLGTLGNPIRNEFYVYLDNLERLQLCVVHRATAQLQKLAEYVDREFAFRLRGYPSAELTSLGQAFLRACSPPSAGTQEGTKLRQ